MKTIIKGILSTVYVMIFVVFFSFKISAHDSDLGIEGYNDFFYDDCQPNDYINSSNIGDGYNEKWYELTWGNVITSTNPNTFDVFAMYHVDDDIKTLYYKFESNGLDQPNTTWSTVIGQNNGNNIVSEYETSMLKWNDVYYYSQNESGKYQKHKIIELVNYDNLSNKDGITPNILIYPYYSTGDFSAETDWISTSEITNESHITNGISHKHFSRFTMQVNTYFLNNSTLLKQRTGAHEVGHILGLFDIDTVENPNEKSKYHHEEILMGYSKNNYASTRQSEITYKDIAGVAITRGYHTDDDHMWLYDASRSSVNNFKLICSICNGVKYVEDLSGYSYHAYYSCQSNHNLSSGNMMPVASYGTKDYYKCKYCRWVAPFTSIEQQSYLYTSLDYVNHLVTNNVLGLEYDFIEPHTTNTNCDKCGFMHAHNYINYSRYSPSQHKVSCICGDFKVEYHMVRADMSGVCIVCGLPVSINSMLSYTIGTKEYITSSGSYIMSNGIIVLVEEDYKDYINGDLHVCDLLGGVMV